ncbi:hypothetical protein [Streptomyces pratensis]|uniref:hypothetical protein n=1 Tax=Streptomyces pratensis TaxID=1169025 RepID=UPI00363A4FED
MGAAPTAVRDASGLLHVDVDHVAGTFATIVFGARFISPSGAMLASVQPEVCEQPGDGAAADDDAHFLDLEGDP